MLDNNEINTLSADEEALIKGALEVDEASLVKIAVEYNVFTIELKKSMKICFDRAYQAEPHNPHYLFLQGFMLQLGIDSLSDYQQAAAFYRQAMISGSGETLFSLAQMIYHGNYCPCAEDFAAAGIADPGGDRYQQVAALYRQTMIYKRGESFFNIAVMIRDGNYSPCTEDFVAAGITDPGDDRNQQTAAFYRKAMIHKVSNSFHNMAEMIIDRNYSPRTEDFAAAGITDPGGGRNQQAAAFYRQALIHNGKISFDNIALMIKERGYSPSASDFAAAGIADPGGDRNQQAAAFHRQGMIHKCQVSFNNVALMIGEDEYPPSASDFAAAGIADPGGDRYQQAAAFHRQGMIHK
jgi:TPR repeat protein